MSLKFGDNEILVYHLKKGDELAYVYLVETYSKILFSYALCLTNNKAMAKDIIQDVFYQVWKSRKKLNSRYSLKGYLFKITYNNYINQYHKNRAMNLLEHNYMDTLNEVISDDNADLLERKIAIVREGITNLPSKCKKVFLLSKDDGLTNNEIAEYLNISIKTVEGHLTKAYQLLRKNVGKKLEKILFLLFNQNCYKY